MVCVEQQTPAQFRTPNAVYVSNGYYVAQTDSVLRQVMQALQLIQNDAFAVTRRDGPTRANVLLDDLATWPAGWNGNDVDAPSPDAIAHARVWIARMYDDALRVGRGWQEPHVSADEQGNPTFEWWNADRKLTVYVSANDAWYIKAWGPDVSTEMSDGTAESLEERQDIWKWLTA